VISKNLFGNCFGKAVSEENIFLEINQSETRIACDGQDFQWIGTK
jgi:hypothetical protein